MEEQEYTPEGVDVIVVNWRSPRFLQEFIESLIDYPPTIPFKLTVFNVQPDYDSYRLGEFCKRTGINHLWSNDNIGYARAVNRSVAETGKELIAIFNADTRFTSNIIDECYQEMMNHDDWGVLGPKQLNEEGKITSGGIVGTNEAPELRWWKQPDSPDKDIIDENCVSVSGSAYFIRRDVWNRITNDETYRAAHLEVLHSEATGAFPGFAHYYEEFACSLMVRALEGLKVVLKADCSMIHHWHKSSVIGSEVDLNMPKVREQFRAMCDIMEIPHE